MKTIAIVTAAAMLLTPGVSLAQKSGGRPDASLEPNYGTVNLRTGFTPDRRRNRRRRTSGRWGC